jgi:hypothetical protein
MQLRQGVDTSLNLLKPLFQLRPCLCKGCGVPVLEFLHVLQQLLAVDAEPAIVIRQPDIGFFLDSRIGFVV